MKSRIIFGLYLLLINLTLLTGCTKDKGFEENITNLESSDNKENDGNKIISTDYKDIVNYLFYDSNNSTKILQVPIDTNLIGTKIISIKCFQDETFKTDNITINEDIISSNILVFELHDYIESFNKLIIETKKDNKEINVGQYYFEKVPDDTLEDFDKAKLVQYHSKEVLNSFIGDFKLEGNFDKHDIEMIIPTKLQELNIIISTLINNNNTFVYECSISDDNFDKNNLKYIYFDSILYQKDRENPNKHYKIFVCQIPLEKSRTKD